MNKIIRFECHLALKINDFAAIAALPGASVVVAVGYFDGGGAVGGRGALAPATAVEGLRRRRVLERRFKRNVSA